MGSRADSRGEDTTRYSSASEIHEMLRTNSILTPSSVDFETPLESAQEYIPAAPNGGWGWVIVVSSLICNLIVDGISYSFGVFLIEFVDAYQETKSKVSLVGSLLSGVYLFVGPIVSAMTNKYGCRPIVISGSIIATSGFVLATFSPNIDILTISYGVVGGIGLGMIYLPAVVMVGHYFDTKRAFATGLALCGSGLGTFIFPPLSEFLLTEFSWHGAMLIIAAITFHGCICGTLMRPLEAKPSLILSDKLPRVRNILDGIKEPTVLKNRSTSESSNVPHSAGHGPQIRERVLEAKTSGEKRLNDTEAELSPRHGVVEVRAGRCGPEDHKHVSGRMPKLPVTGNEQPSVIGVVGSSNSLVTPILGHTDLVNQTGVPESVSPAHDSDEARSPAVTYVSQDKEVTRKDITTDVTQRRVSDVSQAAFNECVPLIEDSSAFTHPEEYQDGSRRSIHVSKEDLARPLYRKDIFYSGSVSNISQFRSQPDMKTYITSVMVIPDETASLEIVSTSWLSRLCGCLPRPARDVLVEMLDVSLLKDTGFMLICLGNFTGFLAMFIPFMFLVDRTASLGIERSQAALLISIIGMANTVGRIAIGMVADLHIVDSLVMTYTSIAVCGIATGLVPFCNSYPLMAANAAVFGLGMAAYVALSSIVICDRMGVEKLTNAFGLLTLMRGLAAMAGPPLAGFMFDSFGSYDLSFFMGGILLLIGTGCLMLLHLPALRQGQRGVMPGVTRQELALKSKSKMIPAKDVRSSSLADK